MARLPIIIYSYSKPEEKKGEIISFLESYIKRCDFDEVIFALARVIGDLTTYFGLEGLKIWNELLENEETIIR